MEKQMLVFKFGIRAITEGLDDAHIEMKQAHHYFNALVAIERWKRAEYGRIRSEYVPGLHEIEEAYAQLDEWIGEHAGKGGARGKIREKRRRASAPKTKGGGPAPTKRVDVSEEVDVITEMKAWRRAASEQMKPLRARFEAMIAAGNAEYKRVTARAPAGNNHPKKDVNAEVRALMLASAPNEHWPELAGYVPATLPGVPHVAVWHPAWKALATLEATAYDLRNWVQDAHDLNHGTYIAVRDAVTAAGKRPPPRPDGEPRKPRARPGFSSKGLRKMGWQVRPGTTWKDVLDGKCGDLRVLEIEPRANPKKKRALIQFRIGTPKGTPSKWITMRVEIHRPIPLDTKILWAFVVPERRATSRWKYTLQLTAVVSQPLIQRVAGTGHVHLHLRWTQLGGTLDIAAANGESIVLPPGVAWRLRHADDIRGHRSKHFDTALATLADHVDVLPEQDRNRCTGFASWRRHYRLHHVSISLRRINPQDLETWKRWRTMRLARRLDLFAPFEEYLEWYRVAVPNRDDVSAFSSWLETWRRKDRHLEQYEEGERRHALGQRRDFYSVTAVRLAERFETYSLGGATDLAALALRDKAEDTPDELHRAARRNRTIASLYEFKEALARNFGPVTKAHPFGARYRERTPAEIAKDASLSWGAAPVTMETRVRAPRSQPAIHID